MDPDATLQCMVGAWRDTTNPDWRHDLDAACFGLYDWLRGGGFAPDWRVAPTDVVDYYVTIAARWTREDGNR